MRATAQGRLGMATGFVKAAAFYWLSVYPYVCREVAHLRRRARAIPDPMLRVLALETIANKRGNLDGAAAFAAFVPFAHRAAVVRSLLAFQAAYDFADTLSEQPSADQAANARMLHESLLVAVKPAAAHRDYYAYSRARDDGGYLAAIVDDCRESLDTLPGYALIAESVGRATARIVIYQTLNIPCPQGSYKAYERWAGTETPRGTDLQWWETGASAGSSLAIFALVAAATSPGLGSADVVEIESAYWPWIGALHTLLDSLVDHEADLASGQQSLVSYYGSPAATARGLRRLALESVRHAHGLDAPRQHLILLTAMTSLYLSAPEAREPHALAATSSVLETMGDLAKPTMAVMGVRRLVGCITEPRRVELGCSDVLPRQLGT
jgi:tetraprenyl-beta-curcumene synthase